MKLSQVDMEKIYDLSVEQKTEIVFGSCADDGLTGAAAILLGGIPEVLRERAQAAAQLYLSGRVPYIIPTGGVEWDTELGRMTEAECMSRLLREYGVPEEAIILENQARTTRENMIFCTLQLTRTLKKRVHYRVYIVTSAAHLRRSLALANLYLPRSVEIAGCPGVCVEGNRENWYKSEFHTKRVHRELELLKLNIDMDEDIDDIEF